MPIPIVNCPCLLNKGLWLLAFCLKSDWIKIQIEWRTFLSAEVSDNSALSYHPLYHKTGQSQPDSLEEVEMTTIKTESLFVTYTSLYKLQTV